MRQNETDYENENKVLKKTKLSFLNIADLMKSQPKKDKISLGALKSFAKCTRKYPWQSFFFNKVAN